MIRIILNKQDKDGEPITIDVLDGYSADIEANWLVIRSESDEAIVSQIVGRFFLSNITGWYKEDL